MSKKKELAEAKARRLQGAIAMALLSAPSPYPWERTVSVSVLVEEVRAFLGMAKNQVKTILTAFKEAIASWMPSGWVTHNKQKDCVTLHKSAEQALTSIAETSAFA